MVYLPQHGAGGSHLKADVPRKVPLAITTWIVSGRVLESTKEERMSRLWLLVEEHLERHNTS